jgi:hypothetical protein
MPETKFQTHAERQAKLSSCIFLEDTTLSQIQETETRKKQCNHLPTNQQTYCINTRQGRIPKNIHQQKSTQPLHPNTFLNYAHIEIEPKVLRLYVNAVVKACVQLYVFRIARCMGRPMYG